MYSLLFRDGREKRFKSMREAADFLQDLLQRNPMTVLAPPEIRCRGLKLDEVDSKCWLIYTTKE